MGGGTTLRRATLLLLWAAVALASVSQLDEDLTFDEDSLALRQRREAPADVAPVEPPSSDDERPSSRILKKRQAGSGSGYGWNFWGSTDDEDADLGSAVEGSGLQPEKRIFRVKFHVLRPWNSALTNKYSSQYARLASEIKENFRLLLRSVSGEKAYQVSNIKKAPSGNIEITLDINHEGWTDESAALRRSIRSALDSGYLGLTPVNTQYFSFAEPGATVALTPCPPGKWKCPSGRCVNQCDGSADCLDGSDERDCVTPTRVTGSTQSKPTCRSDDQGPRQCNDGTTYACFCDGITECPTAEDEASCGSGCRPNQFSCDGGGQCLDEDQVCDGRVDCYDGMDEALETCAIAATTTTTTTARPPPVCRSDDQGPIPCDDGTTYACRCDNIPECPGGEDENPQICGQGCSADQFSCDGGTICLDTSKVCDTKYDCYDQSDEENCGVVVPCRNDEYTCKDGTCVESFRQCDGIVDCNDGDDEESCPGETCQNDEYKCNDGNCISITQRCDGIPQCSDRSDEDGCPCDATQWTCRDGSCIPQEARCNRLYDCPDYSDEENCQQECGIGEWTCRNGDCIPDYQRCDNTPQCIDRSDEENCVPVACSSSEWTCSDGTCIPQEARCNRQYDCPDYSDEEQCEGCRADEWTCRNGDCIPGYQHCDGTPHCLDRSDEENCNYGCGRDQWTCRDGSCIPATGRCNRIPECIDRSDEENCPGCSAGEWTCGDLTCIPETSRCNGQYDCRDYSDEQGCQVECGRDQWTCRDGSCIPASGRCDRIPQCLDRSDEENCPGCSSGQWTCGDLTCIPEGARCNGQYDCPDYSDEQNCPVYTCRPDQFRCEDGRCLEITQRCNGREECSRGEDERECGCRYDEFTCVSDRFCISNARRCDGYVDCRDGSDEQECTRTTTAPPVSNKCNQDEFECGNGNCVLRAYLCDGIPDCTDGSDEVNCTSLPTCRSNEFPCNTGECISLAKKCDRINDCLDGSDELQCSFTDDRECTADEFRCNDGVCIEKEWRCDSVPDCGDASDEVDCCNTNEFQCGDKRCIPDDKLCDGTYDCTDGSDESANCECREDEFRCGNGACIPGYQQCNGFPECLDGLDEQNCQNSGGCTASEFTCGSGDCVSQRVVCDGSVDCNDGSDEFDCRGTGNTCSSYEFSCGNGTCIYGNARCDGFRDCPDGSDELNCGPIRGCEDYEFTCGDGTCVSLSVRCDGQEDCRDGADELNCRVPSRCQPYEFRCRAGRCIPDYKRCDGRQDCRDGSDEELCYGVTETTPPTTITTTPAPVFPPANLFRCFDGSYIKDYLRCDGRRDCQDGSDEEQCSGTDSLNLRTYPDQQTIQQSREVVFQCRDEGSIRASVKWVREGNRAMPIGTTDVRGRLTMPNIQIEHQGTYYCEAQGVNPSMAGRRKPVYLQVIPYTPPTQPPVIVCSVNEATCMNGQCIDKSKVCNGVYDCDDASDEMRCNPLGCEPNEFQCDNKRCVLKTWLCDSDDDCGDGSDERECVTNPPGSACRYNEFTCLNGSQCIPKSFHCDGEVDCLDSSDEQRCTKPIIVDPPPRNIVVAVSESFTITCRAVGVPTPTVIWRLNWGHVPDKCKMSSEDGRGTLTCPGAQPTDQGAYSCEAINSLGSVFAQPDCIVQVQGGSPICQPPQFNAGAVSPEDCLSCFCFGATDQCYSTDRYITQLPPPLNDSYQLVGANLDQFRGNYVVREKEYPLSPRYLRPQSYTAVRLYVDRTKLGGPSDLIVYFSLPDSHKGQQLTSYGGYLRYSIQFASSTSGTVVNGPDVVMVGNGLTLMHVHDGSFRPNEKNQIDVKLQTGQWFKRVTGQGYLVQTQEPASREEIMMVLENVQLLLIRAQYTDALYIETTLSEVQMDTAVIHSNTQGRAMLVEECRCPTGYVGLSCQDCAPNYKRVQDGPWLGRCVPDDECRPGEYGDPANGIPCLPCPCPLTTPTNQFSSSCYLASDGQVTCNCQQGYQGRRCEVCASGYEGNPSIPGDSCRPAVDCDPAGSYSVQADPVTGLCQCKDFVTGPKCDRCKEGTFFLNERNRFGCIDCFCMGFTKSCTSSNWYRAQETASFTNDRHGFELVEKDQKTVVSNKIYVDAGQQEIVFREFSRSGQEVYYWNLPQRFLGDKVSSYGGNLTYTVRYVPAPGGQSSANSAADVEIYGNDITLRHFRRGQVSRSLQETLTVPFYEDEWERQSGQKANREHFLMVLADLEYIQIKATYTTNTQEVALKEVIMDYAEPRNTGQERAYAVEFCQCPPGYKGLSCEDCDVGYTRSESGIHLGECHPCDCNGHSEECNPDTGVCSNCRDNTAGNFCERCADGFFMDPTGRCTRIGPGADCNCDPRGSLSTTCRDGRCQCKANVRGDNCDACQGGFFHLSSGNPEGCLRCWCSGVTSQCFSSNYYQTQLPMQLLSNHGFAITNRLRTNIIRDRFDLTLADNEISFSNFNELNNVETYYWSLPQMFTGNRLASYGGNLTISQRYLANPGGNTYADPDVIIRSTGGREFIWMNSQTLRQNTLHTYVVPLIESSFTMNQQPASRSGFLQALSSVEAIFIRATLNNRMRVTSLRDVIMDTAVPSETGQPRAVAVEQCQCPAEYGGLSCEQCKPGYYRELGTNMCLRCQCNGHEESCVQLPSGEVKCKCLPGYFGDHCEGSGPPSPRPDDQSLQLTILTPTIQVVSSGSTVQMKCQARSRQGPQNRVSVTWNKADGELPYGRSVDDRQGLLVISQVQVSDSGTYICTASDGFHFISRNATLDVGGSNVGSPRVTIEERREILEVRRGQTLEIRCSAQGSPQPQVVWSRGPNRERLPYNVQQQNGILIFRDVETDNDGEYFCTATNSLGTDYARIIISVVESRPFVTPAPQPLIIVQVSEQEVEVKAGETVRVSCSSPNPGTLRIEWNRVGGNLPTQSSVSSGLLLIPNARAVDSGIYVCRITDERSSFYEESSTRITINEPWIMPTVQIQPDRQTINQGSNAELTCIVTGTPSPQIKWSKVNEEFGVGVQVEGNVLRIFDAVVSDRGMYVCTAENPGGMAQGAAIVEVERREPPSVQIYPQVKQTIVVGASALFQCHLTGGIPSPVVRWGRTDGRPLSINTETLNGGVLRFNQVQGDEEGSYTCTAENDAGSVTASAVLEIQSLPLITIRQGPSPYAVRVGERLVLDCSASGDPSPSVTWQKLEINLPTNVPSQSTAPNIAVYEVQRATKNDAGTYQCSARNAAGVSEERIQVIVEDALPGYIPEIVGPIQPETPTIYVPIGGNYEFTCRDQGPDAATTTYEFKRSDNRPLPRGNRIEDGVLYLTNVDQSASGEYACIGKDRISGIILFTIYATFEVIAPPRITLDPARQIVRPGDLVHIRCIATGPQPITINWSKDGGYMPPSVIINGGEMMFRGIETSDAGRYICQAVNNAGTARAVAEVIVNEEPLLTAIQRDIVRFVGQTAELRCEASGIDPNAVRWTRLGGSLPPSALTRGNLLRLSALRPEDSGQYQCEASSPAGYLSSVINLTVQRQQTVAIRITPSRRNVRIGDDVELRCDVSGQTQASITWARENSRLPQNARPQGNVLRLTDVQANNGGIYLCVVTTANGAFEERFPLAIQGLISAERIDFSQNQRSVVTRSVAFGLSVVMECRISLPPPVSYTWSKQGGELPVNSLVQDNVLDIPEVHIEDAGLYVCTGSNNERSVDQATLLVVTGVIPRFGGESYLTLPTLPRAYLAFDLEISFKPESPDGLILYNSQRDTRADGDFVAFGLNGGYAEFRFDVGSGPAIIKSRSPLAMNEWHTIKLSRDRKEGTMIVNNGSPISGRSVGRFLGLDLVTPMYLGGVADFNKIHEEAGYTEGYRGCISRLVIRNSVTVDLMRDSKARVGITPCMTCQGQPCQNNGVCQEAYTDVGHKCICPAGFSGQLCENTGEACYPGVCGTGRCVNKPGGFECFCPFGKIGQRCEMSISIEEPAFGDDSYIAYPTPRALKRFAVDLNFKPESLEDGLLMYCSQKYRGEGDFTSLAIRNKRLEFRFNTGSGTATLQSDPLQENEWVEVRANRTDRRGSMTINGGKLQDTESPGSNRGLNLLTPLYIGGVDNTRVEISPEVGVEAGFKGCVKEIKIMDQKVRLAESLVDSANVGQCGGASIAHCTENPCVNMGVCSEDPASPQGYRCSCQEGYSGQNCEVEPGVCTIVKPCKNGGECKGAGMNYFCKCPLGFAGQHCEHAVTIGETASFNGKSWVEFDQLMLPQEDGIPEKVSFEFSTVRPNGLLFWYGQEPTTTGHGNDYIGVAIKDGIVEFTYDVGAGPAMIQSKARVDDGERHTLLIERAGRRGSLVLDNLPVEYGQSPGRLHMLNAQGNIYIGGVPNHALMTDNNYPVGFHGCIHKLTIGSEGPINFMESGLSGVNVNKCASSGEWEVSSESRNTIHSGRGNTHSFEERYSYTGPTYNHRTHQRTTHTSRKVFHG